METMKIKLEGLAELGLGMAWGGFCLVLLMIGLCIGLAIVVASG